MDQVSRILASPQFADSERMIRFLRFAVEETLQRKVARLKEIVIGAEVFDRPPTYDTRLDPIVRVEARRLRAKLARYYEAEGREDAIVIELPKGHYAPVFRTRTDAAPATHVDTPAVENTIAVLPFTNLNAAGENTDYFSDGLSEDLIHALIRIPGLRVAAWTSAAQLRENQEDMGAIRERLRVAHVLRGSVRRTEERLRINAHLIDTVSGHYVWSESYDRELRDVLAIQEQIAAAIAAALKIRFGKAATPPGVCGVECYQLYLKGRFHANERTAVGLRRSVVCFEQAIALDNTSAVAYSGLADAYTLMSDYSFMEPCDGLPKAKQAALRALELDPELGEAHASLAYILTIHDWNWKAAGLAFRRAIALNPAYAAAHHWYSVDYLAPLGRYDEAREEIALAIDLDPLMPIVREGRAYLSTLQRRYDQAISEFLEILKTDPSYFKACTSIGRAYIQMGRYVEAIEWLEKGRALAGTFPSVLGALGQAHGLAGNHAEARKMLEELQGVALRGTVPYTSFALAHLGLGDNDAALTWLEKGADKRQGAVTVLNVHPAYDALRQEPRFQALLARIGFPRLDRPGALVPYRKLTASH